MSYTLQLWDKPADWPWPTTKAEADAQFERMLDSPPTVQNPKFLEWGTALHARYPEAMDVWLDGSEEGTTTDPVLGFGINTRSDHWAEGFDWAWAQATRLGLNLYDPQSGVHYLGNGDVPEEPDLQVQQAVRARKAGDDATAWAEYRRWAARGNAHAIYAIGRSLRFGTLGQRRHFHLSAALQRMAAPSAAERADAQAFFDRFPPEDQARIQMLMAQLTSASGEMLLQIVDRERESLDQAYAQTRQKLLFTRQMLDAIDDLKAVALLGHEVAAFEYALYNVTGWEEPSYDNARYWCRRAAEWDHEPAQRLLALMHERGWGGPPDPEQAARWQAAAREQREAAAATEPGGLRLAAMEPTATRPQGPAPTGIAFLDLVGWYAHEGDANAAYRLGLACEHGRDGAMQDLARARAWYAQAAEAGHGDATYNLGVQIEQGRGGPRDALAAKALFMLSNTRGATVRVDDLRIAPTEQAPLRALVMALREPGRLRAVLQQRGLGADAPASVAVAVGAAAGLSAADWGRAGEGTAATAPLPTPLPTPSPTPSPAPTRPPAPRQAPRPAPSREDDADGEAPPPRARIALHLGHVALAVGVANVVLLIAFAKPGAGFRLGMAMLGLVAAYGAWRTTRDMDWSPAARLATAVLAAVPLLGMAVCFLLLSKAVRERA